MSRRLSNEGSSPLARGLHREVIYTARTAGIIPARAGFTPPPARSSTASTDHPRSRGVYPASVPLHTVGGGSSPLARGLRAAGGGRRGRRRIIPARAGFTRAWGLPASLKDGSSPLARGLPRRDFHDRLLRRIIPARAGFTPWRVKGEERRRDHPRSRGVYRRRPAGQPTCPGSSPLARGLPGRRRWPAPGSGIIPARAGFTCSSPRRRSRRRDHPRSRGVYTLVRWIVGNAAGSSPLARGLRGRPLLRPSGVRIIPARAGFTAQ